MMLGWGVIPLYEGDINFREWHTRAGCGVALPWPGVGKTASPMHRCSVPSGFTPEVSRGHNQGFERYSWTEAHCAGLTVMKRTEGPLGGPAGVVSKNVRGAGIALDGMGRALAE